MPFCYLYIKTIFFKVRVAYISKMSLLPTNTSQPKHTHTHTPITIKDIRCGHSYLRSDWGVKGQFPSSLMWLLIQSLSFSTQGYLNQSLAFHHDSLADFLQSKQARARKTLCASYDLVSEMYITSTLFYL